MARYRNISGEAVNIPVQTWSKGDDRIDLTLIFEAGEITDDFGPENPMGQLLQKHPSFEVFSYKTVWDRLVEPEEG